MNINSLSRKPPTEMAANRPEIKLSDTVTMSFQYIPAGSFMMGSRGKSPSEEPRHLVRVSSDFYLGTYPVTQEQFSVWRSRHENGFPNCPLHPAEGINWYSARDYCKWLTDRFEKQLPLGYVASLPTEAQWEYACRAGTETEYYTGDG